MDSLSFWPCSGLLARREPGCYKLGGGQDNRKGRCMKRYIFGAIAIVAAVVAIVLIRTFAVATPVQVLAGAPPISVNSMDVAQHLAAAVRFKTISSGTPA